MKCLGPKGYLTRAELLLERPEDREKRYAAMRKEDAEMHRVSKAKRRVKVAEEALKTATKYCEKMKNSQRGKDAVDRARAVLEDAEEKAAKVFRASVAEPQEVDPDLDLLKRRTILAEALDLTRRAKRGESLWRG
jgi:lipopolysaccharide biosynthesis regulator YciM